MSKISDAHAAANKSEPEPAAATSRRAGLSLLLDICIVVLMGGLLFWGAASQFPNLFNDATRYQCYAVGFWHGSPALATLPPPQCAFLSASSSSSLAQKLQARHFPGVLVKLVAAQSTARPLHLLPPEYPLLTLVPFSLALIVPQQWYQVAFAFEMALVAGSIYFLLKRYRSTTAAIAFAVYLVIGSWATAEGRFDLVTAALTLGAVILATKARWNWAFVLLALATMLKFYPVVLVPPLLIAQHRQGRTAWRSWRRWQGLALFIVICGALTGFSLILNVADTLNPFRYFINRPIQVESLPGALVWLGSLLGRPLQYVFTFQSLNVVSSLSSKISLLSTALLVVGILTTYWLQWRAKIDIFMSSLLTLLLVLIFGKVLSPQYLMWVAPFIAYAGGCNCKWLLSWGCVAVLTTIIFPFVYVDLPHIIHYYPLVFVRDLLILAITLVLLYTALRGRYVPAAQPVAAAGASTAEGGAQGPGSISGG